MLNEIPSVFGLELATLVRQLWLAAEVDGTDVIRPKLFAPTTAVHVGERRTEALHEAPRGARAPLRVLMRLTGRRPPTRAELAAACETLADWAQEAGHTETAIQIAEAGAAISPGPRSSFIAARTNRYADETWRSEIFYARAIRVAYRLQDWDTYVRAHLGYARLESDRGRVRAAAGHFVSAARVALDQGHAWLAAQVYHDLISHYYELGETKRAFDAAIRALTIYPRHHERYPLAVHDFAVLLLLQRRYAEAWPLLKILIRAPLRPHDEVIAWGTYARAAGSLGHHEEYAEAEARVLRLTPHYPTFAAAAYLGLSIGAHALGDDELARHYVERGITIAERRRDRQALRELREIEKEIEEGVELVPAPPLRGEPADRLAELAGLLNEHVRAWRAETWTRKENQYGLATLGPV
ncbi:MAG TPA: tetratricopeptide repeat protein [Longimicrobium sp.]